MPAQEYPDIALSSTEPDNDLAWMNAVLSPSGADASSRSATAFPLDEGSALAIAPDLPPSSYRLQFLRAWIAARGGRLAEAPGHA